MITIALAHGAVHSAFRSIKHVSAGKAGKLFSNPDIDATRWCETQAFGGFINYARLIRHEYFCDFSKEAHALVDHLGAQY